MRMKHFYIIWNQKGISTDFDCGSFCPGESTPGHSVRHGERMAGEGILFMTPAAGDDRAKDGALPSMWI